MLNDETDKAIKQLFDSLKINIETIWNKSKVVSLYLTMFSYCIINVTENIRIVMDYM